MQFTIYELQEKLDEIHKEANKLALEEVDKHPFSNGSEAWQATTVKIDRRKALIRKIVDEGYFDFDSYYGGLWNLRPEVSNYWAERVYYAHIAKGLRNIGFSAYTLDRAL